MAALWLQLHPRQVGADELHREGYADDAGFRYEHEIGLNAKLFGSQPRHFTGVLEAALAVAGVGVAGVEDDRLRMWLCVEPFAAEHHWRGGKRVLSEGRDRDARRVGGPDTEIRPARGLDARRQCARAEASGGRGRPIGQHSERVGGRSDHCPLLNAQRGTRKG